jgi:hypothetical protein
MRFLILISILALFFSCRKKEEDTTTPSTMTGTHGSYSMACPNGTSHSPLNSDLARMKFLASTWWVYTDSVTLQSDSVYVYPPVDMPNHFCLGLNPCVGYDAFYSIYRHSLDLRADTIFVMTGAWINGNMRSAFVPFYPTCPTAFYIPYNASDWTYAQQKYTGGQDTIIRYDSVFVYDRFYRQVETAILQQNPAEGFLKTIYYVNSEYGILRKDVFDANGTLQNKWVLKSKNIVR